MTICALGWYGTETLGDRAILDGLFQVFQGCFSSFTVHLGSLYPFVSERTILEDLSFYNCNSPGLKLDCFDVKDERALANIVKQSDFVVMAGGPIMDLHELFYVCKGLAFAKKKHKKTALLGCGYSSLKIPALREVVGEMLSLADLVVLRGKKDHETLLRDFPSVAQTKKTIASAMDPAVLSAARYQKKAQPGKKDYVVANYRDVLFLGVDSIVQPLAAISDDIIGGFPHGYFMPMHTFSIGGDDRLYLLRVQAASKKKDVGRLFKSLCLCNKPTRWLGARRDA